MKSKEEIVERIQEEAERLRRDQGHMASITRGWLSALQWVLGLDE